MNTEIVNNIYYTGVNDRAKHKFEGLWPLPLGVSYNSYLIVDKEIALIDTVDHCHSDLFLYKIKNIIGERQIDYLIINHMEPDHSASIGFIQKQYPNIKIIGNSKTKGMIEGFYGICNNVLEVEDESTLSLGEKQLKFYMTPMVHWPETMMTYCENDKVLFSGDAFGCFGALNGGFLDSKINVDCYWDEMYRYYSNIVGKYGAPVQKALKKLSETEIDYICSTHGPVWHEHRAKVISLYNDMSLYKGENGVVIAYGSMYGNTEQMAEMIAASLSENGISNIIMHNVTKSDLSYVLRDIFKYNGLIIGSPTYTNELFPEIEALTSKLQSRGIKNRYFGYFGSFCWAGAAVKKLAEFGTQMGWDVLDCSVEMKQGMNNEIVKKCEALASEMANKIKY